MTPRHHSCAARSGGRLPPRRDAATPSGRASVDAIGGRRRVTGPRYPAIAFAGGTPSSRRRGRAGGIGSLCRDSRRRRCSTTHRRGRARRTRKGSVRAQAAPREGACRGIATIRGASIRSCPQPCSTWPDWRGRSSTKPIFTVHERGVNRGDPIDASSWPGRPRPALVTVPRSATRGRNCRLPDDIVIPATNQRRPAVAARGA